MSDTERTSEHVPEQAETAQQEAAPVEDRVDALSGKVDQILSFLSGGKSEGAGTESEPEAPADVAAEVRAELAKLKAADERKAARDKEKSDAENRLKAVEDKVKEQPPREYRKVTNFMGWSDEGRPGKRAKR